MKRLYLLLLALSTMLVVYSCGGPRTYVNSEADFGFYEKVGVLPFSNLSGDRNASEKVTASFVTELLIGGEVEMANMGDLLKSFKTTVKDDRANLPEQLTIEEGMTIGRDAGVQGLFVGAVREYGMVRVGTEEFPLVSLNIRFIDCQTGKVAWTYETTKRGGPKFPIFSFGETHTLGEMTSKVCRSAAGDFLGKVK
ncbi:MAG: hypothetical protein IPH75_05125 [bacterium]|nr:hypothetical protein [bacterium]